MGNDSKILRVFLQLNNQLTPHLQKAGAAGSSAFSQLRTSAQRFHGVLGSLKSQLIGLAVAFGLAMSIRKFIDFLRSATREAYAFEQANAKLRAGLQKIPGASYKTETALLKQADALQTLSGYSNTQIMHAQAMLATFKLSEKGLLALTPRLVDMAAAMDKAGEGTKDLQALAIALGKGISVGAGALSRYGVVMSPVQKAQLETAMGMERINLICEILDDNFGGIAEEVGNTFYGALMKMNSGWSDAKRKIGDWITLSPGVIEIMKTITKWVQKGTDKLDAMNKSGQDVFGKAFAQIIKGGLQVVIVLTKLHQLYLMVAIGANKFGIAHAWAARMMIEFQTLGLANTKWLQDLEQKMKSNVSGLEETLSKAIGVELTVSGMMDEIDVAMTKADAKAKSALSGWTGAANKTEEAIKAVSEAEKEAAEKQEKWQKWLGQAKRVWEALLQIIMKVWDEHKRYIDFVKASPNPFERDVTKSDQQRETAEFQKRRQESIYSAFSGGQANDQAIVTLRTRFNELSAVMQPFIDIIQKALATLGINFGTGGGGTGGDKTTKALKGFDLMKSNDWLAPFVTATATAGIGGGGTAMLKTALPMIGSAFGPWGAAIGSLISAFIPEKRGASQDNPVYVKDVQLKTALEALTNVSKAMLNIRAGKSFTSISSNSYRLEAMRMGAL